MASLALLAYLATPSALQHGTLAAVRQPRQPRLSTPSRCLPLLSAPEASFFSKLLPAHIEATLASRGMLRPTPIQEASIERLLAGESLLLHAETGSGKSLAFLLPILLRLGVLASSPSAPSPSELTADVTKVLVVAPTRELSVQLANEAASLVGLPDVVQIVAAGVTPSAPSLLSARVVCGTAEELLALLGQEGDQAGVMESVLQNVRALVLDELDTLLPVAATYGPRAKERKKKELKKSPPPAAEALLRAVLESCAATDLQVIAASATISRPSRLKLERVLRRDPLGRFYDKTLAVVRPAHVEAQDLTSVARAVVVPSGVRHWYVRLPAVTLTRASPAQKARRTPASKLTLKQKRALKLEKQRAGSKQAHISSLYGTEAHPLLVTLRDAIDQLQPKSALVFLCRSSGMTVRRAAKELRGLGLPAQPLHEAIGLEHADSAEAAALAAQSEDVSVRVQLRHRAIADAFTVRGGAPTKDAISPRGGVLEEDAAAARAASLPLIVTFEDMARGLHFDAVETVFILGIPDSPATYLHLAGRTGRYPVLEGSVVTVCPRSAHTQLTGWSTRLGGIHFNELHLVAEKGEGDMAEVEDGAEDSEWKSAPSKVEVVQGEEEQVEFQS
ncbi:hypothetical protein AB1Y20_011225 [Prymnesium parvum]|uniref:RNA helicase n=1 Tax=Prymnesium parvum TaxID=97485 RepID=A0AB34IL96_PRYPA